MNKLLQRILFFIPFIFLALIIILTFFQHPVADDFVLNFFVKKWGIIGAYKFYMFSDYGTGRYFSVFLYLCFSSSNFLMDNYWIGLVFMIIISFICYFVFIRYFISVLFDYKLKSFQLLWLTAVLQIIILAIVPEQSTFYYWFATSFTYMFSFALLLLYMITLHYAFFSITVQSKIFAVTAAFVFAFILSGFNEISLYFSALLTGLIVAHQFLINKKIQLNLFLLVCFHIFLGGIVFLIPGNRGKAFGFTVHQSIMYSAAGSLYQASKIFYYIFSNPLTWISFLAIIFIYPFLKDSFKRIIERKQTSFVAELFFLFIVVWFFDFVIRHWGNWVVPQRANNIIVCCATIALFVIVACNSFILQAFIQKGRQQIADRKIILSVFFLLLFCFNSFTTNLLESIIVAPVHLAVLNKRINEIKLSKINNKHSVFFKTYEEESKDVLSKMYNAKTVKFINDEFVLPPTFIFLKYKTADMEFDGAYAAYYGIDSIVTSKNIIIAENLKKVTFIK